MASKMEDVAFESNSQSGARANSSAKEGTTQRKSSEKLHYREGKTERGGSRSRGLEEGERPASVRETGENTRESKRGPGGAVRPKYVR